MTYQQKRLRVNGPQKSVRRMRISRTRAMAAGTFRSQVAVEANNALIAKELAKYNLKPDSFTLFLPSKVLHQLDSGSCITTHARGIERSNVTVCKEGGNIKIFKIDRKLDREGGLP